MAFDYKFSALDGIRNLLAYFAHRQNRKRSGADGAGCCYLPWEKYWSCSLPEFGGRKTLPYRFNLATVRFQFYSRKTGELVVAEAGGGGRKYGLVRAIKGFAVRFEFVRRQNLRDCSYLANSLPIEPGRTMELYSTDLNRSAVRLLFLPIGNNRLEDLTKSLPVEIFINSSVRFPRSTVSAIC